jgi:hypothetical protein
LSVPTFDTKVDKFIKTCQEEVKTNIIEDVFFAGSQDTHHQGEPESEEYFPSEIDHTYVRNPHPFQTQRRVPTQTLKYEDFDLSEEEERKAALKWHRRMKRQIPIGATRRSDFHGTTVSNEDKFVAGVRQKI